MLEVLLRLLLIAAFVLLHLGLYRLVARDRSLGFAAIVSAALTFQVWFWTVLCWILGTFEILNLGPLAIVGTVVGGLLVWMSKGTSGPPLVLMIRRRLRTISPWCLPFALPALISAIFWLVYSWWSVPIDYDGLSYHIGTALHMYQDGDFRLYEGESIYTNYFGRGSELVGVFLLHLFGTINTLNMIQWVVMPPLCLALFTAARALGAGRTGGIIAASWPFGVPVLVYQTAMTYADLKSLGWIVVGLCAVLSACRLQRPGAVRMLWMFTACGLAVATKFNAATASVVVGVAAILLWGWRPFFLPRRHALGVALVGFLAAAMAGLFWPARNWIVAGSPIYPFSLELGPVMIAEGLAPMEGIRLMPETPPPDRTWEEWPTIPLAHKIWMSWTYIDFESWGRFGPLGAGIREAALPELHDPFFGYRGDNKLGGLGLAWLVALLPLSCVYLVWISTTLLNGRNARSRQRLLALYRLGLPIACWGIFYVTLAPWWPRFSMFLPLLGALMGVVLLAATTRSKWFWVVYILMLLPFLKDLATPMLFQRDREVQRRFLAEMTTHRPVDYFLWQEPDKLPHLAIAEILDKALPGETVSFHTPGDPVFTGLFTNSAGTIRQFVLPTMFPPPGTYSDADQLAMIARERPAFILLGYTSHREFGEEIIAMGGRVVSNRHGWRVVEFPEWRHKE